MSELIDHGPHDNCVHDKHDAEASVRSKQSLQELEPTHAEDEDQFATGSYLYLLTLALMLAVLLMGMDSTIVSTAIPHITSEFHSLPDVGWYGSAYLLAQTLMMPVFGKLYTWAPLKQVWIGGLLVFELGSIVCAVAPTSASFIAGRALAGGGAASILTGGLTVVGYAIPLRKRAPFIALCMSMNGVSNIVAPLLGGVFTDSERLTWRFCFWINLPLGAFTILFFLLFFRNPVLAHQQSTWRQKLKQLDLLGGISLTSGITCLFVALQLGGSSFAWSDSRVWGCLLGAGLLLSIFVALQIMRRDASFVPLRLLSNRAVLTSSAFNLSLNAALFVYVYYVPLYFQAVLDTSARDSGLRLIAFLLATSLFAVLAGNLVRWSGHYFPFMWAGSALFVVWAGLLLSITPSTGVPTWMGFEVLGGAGFGLASQTPIMALHAALRPEDMAMGNAVYGFCSIFGSTLSVSIGQSIMTNELIKGLAALANINVEGVISAGATGYRDVVPASSVGQVEGAWDFALHRVFISGLAFAAMAVVVGLGVPRKSLKGEKKDEVGEEELHKGGSAPLTLKEDDERTITNNAEEETSEKR